MRLLLSVAALVALSGCGKSAGAGENWILYSYEESTSAGDKYTVQEAINIKSVSSATFYPQRSKDEPLLWMMCAGREVKIRGPKAEAIWKDLQKNN